MADIAELYQPTYLPCSASSGNRSARMERAAVFVMPQPTPRREKAHRHEEVDVLACRAENRREREHGEPDDHDLLLVELVAENTRCKSEREPEERGSCDPEVDEPLRGVRERLVDVGGDGLTTRSPIVHMDERKSAARERASRHFGRSEDSVMGAPFSSRGLPAPCNWPFGQSGSKAPLLG